MKSVKKEFMKLSPDAMKEVKGGVAPPPPMFNMMCRVNWWDPYFPCCWGVDPVYYCGYDSCYTTGGTCTVGSNC